MALALDGPRPWKSTPTGSGLAGDEHDGLDLGDCAGLASRDQIRILDRDRVHAGQVLKRLAGSSKYPRIPRPGTDCQRQDRTSPGADRQRGQRACTSGPAAWSLSSVVNRGTSGWMSWSCAANTTHAPLVLRIGLPGSRD